MILSLFISSFLLVGGGVVAFSPTATKSLHRRSRIITRQQHQYQQHQRQQQQPFQPFLSSTNVVEDDETATFIYEPIFNFTSDENAVSSFERIDDAVRCILWKN